MKFKTFFAIIIGIALGILIKTTCFDIAKIEGDSMLPSLESGAKIPINKLAYGLAIPFSSTLLFQWDEPQIDDLIVYKHKNKTVVKRCVGISGQPLDYSSDSRYIIVGENAFPLTEQQFQRIKFDKVVPAGTVLAIGDNYDVSVDSRDYGFVPVKNILGRVIQ